MPGIDTPGAPTHSTRREPISGRTVLLEDGAPSIALRDVLAGTRTRPDPTWEFAQVFIETDDALLTVEADAIGFYLGVYLPVGDRVEDFPHTCVNDGSQTRLLV